MGNNPFFRVFKVSTWNVIPMRKFLKILEIIIIYICLPLFVKYQLELKGMYKVIPVVVIAVIMVIVLWNDKGFNKKILFRWVPVQWSNVWLRVAGLTLLTFLVVYFFYPHLLFQFPQDKWSTYILALALYPFASVIPQEIAFRVWYYHRYQDVFSSTKLSIFLNSLCFGFVHVVFDNWIAMLGAFVFSFFFSYTYRKYKSLPIVATEHYLYGVVIFTIGLGKFFT